MALLQVRSEISGKVWKIEAAPGQAVRRDAPLLVLESMKMEIPVAVPADGTLRELMVAEGDMVREGQVLAVVDAEA